MCPKNTRIKDLIRVDEMIHWYDKPRRQPESGAKAAIRQYLELHGLFMFRIQQGALSEPGLSDLMGIKTVKTVDLLNSGIKEIGVFVAVETKRLNRKGGTHPQQGRFLANVKDRGGLGAVGRSIEDVEVIVKWPKGITI